MSVPTDSLCPPKRQLEFFISMVSFLPKGCFTRWPTKREAIIQIPHIFSQEGNLWSLLLTIVWISILVLLKLLVERRNSWHQNS
jgi:hypothetical protein